jgi:hypothetical protein
MKTIPAAMGTHEDTVIFRLPWLQVMENQHYQLLIDTVMLFNKLLQNSIA